MTTETEVKPAAPTQPDIAKLAAALAKAQGAITIASKDRIARVRTETGKDFEYSYSTLADLWEVARKPLSDNEIAVLQPANVNGDSVRVATVLVHSSGQTMRCELAVPLGGKKDAQAIGVAMSYGRKFGLASMVGIATDEGDGEKASPAPAKFPAVNAVEQAFAARIPAVADIESLRALRTEVGLAKGLDRIATKRLNDMMSERAKALKASTSQPTEAA